MRTSVAVLATLLCLTPARAGSPLKMVPSDALGFAHVRVDALWQSDAMKDFRAIIQKAGPDAVKAFDARFLPNPSSLSEITVILLKPADAESSPVPVFLVSTKKPVDREAFVKATFGEVRKAPQGRGGNFFLDESGDNGLFFLDDTTFGFASEKTCAAFVTRKAEPAGGPFASALKDAASKHMTMAFNPSAIPESAIGDPGPFRSMLKAQAAWLSVDIQKQASIDVRMSFANDADAKKAEKAIRAYAQLGREALDQVRVQAQAMVAGDPNRKGPSPVSEMPQAAAALFGLGMMSYYDELLDKLPLERTGSEVVMHLDVPEGPYTSIVAVWAIGVGMAIPSVQRLEGASARSTDQNNLKQMALAFHNYADTYNNGFPAAAICDKKGKPLLSWRVAILPYIEQDNLYRQFKLDEPWDSEHNLKLAQTMPKVYMVPGHHKQGSTETHYRVAVGNPGDKGENLQTPFGYTKSMRIERISDGTSNTAMILTAEESVPWTKPDELVCEAGKPLPKLASFFNGGSNFAFCDGSVRYIKVPLDPKKLRKLLAADDGENPALDD